MKMFCWAVKNKKTGAYLSYNSARAIICFASRGRARNLKRDFEKVVKLQLIEVKS